MNCLHLTFADTESFVMNIFEQQLHPIESDDEPDDPVCTLCGRELMVLVSPLADDTLDEVLICPIHSTRGVPRALA